ncbi:hypothetical protein PRUPE_8G213900 [Prunus persica]|uniref:NADP-dependent oxidoreductase domain-containing protein n=1 Tax=Prunus persica TaxID=3760 RepID=M5VNF1_PRUPE|nr:hypothetical protein PRUPE_8G213900 [Prunus persica]
MQLGYRHFDTAKIYGSEPAALGNALTEAILDANFERDDIFVTSKLLGSDHLSTDKRERSSAQQICNICSQICNILL